MLSPLDVPLAITLPSEPIGGELYLIPQFPADEEIHHERQPHQPQDQVAESNAVAELLAGEDTPGALNPPQAADPPTAHNRSLRP